MLINIHGLSGSGKTFFIKKILAKGQISFFFNKYNKFKKGLHSNINSSISLIPVPLFKGDLNTFLEIYSLKSSSFFDNHGHFNNLAKSIFGEFNSKEIEILGKRRIESLSAGEMRRLFILKSILVESDLVIIDEPFANSDESLWNMIFESIKYIPNSIILSHKPLDQVFELDLEHTILNIKDINKKFQ